MGKRDTNLSKEELFIRNFTKELIEKERQKRIKLLEKISERKEINLTRNKTESYTIIEMTSIVIFFPLSLLIQINPLKEFWDLDKETTKENISKINTDFGFVFLMVSIIENNILNTARIDNSLQPTRYCQKRGLSITFDVLLKDGVQFS
ncbi:MAG: hypothetical protein HWD58_18870 [Bacteroidota bacterium]|nr:MAG: hypothetical protein HWD58_18870 [Bacteroidota bacterium]